MNAGTETGIGLGQLERSRDVKRLHETFLEALDRRDGAGDPLPEWEDVPSRERQAWRAVDVLVRLRVEQAETQLGLVRSERDALVEEVKALRSQVRYLEVLRNQDDLETRRAKLELEALRGARRRHATPPPSVQPLVEAAQDSVPTDATATLVSVKVTAVAPDEDGGGLYLAVEHGLHEAHQGATVRLKGTKATAEVASVEPTASLPIFISFHSPDFAPKEGDVLELLPKPGDELPARIA
ncbi:hypothetical protein [Corallococcus aberystwythensis]|uniref:Uncharacterized protein n=1 Tax=Corallococcus aberystwythensis TaxID=2316722 RepID=A0A3A8P7W7_9BACT|nr:hypothetical protein [Corallococcus aberystwythensis]RKH51490.1 hypothetical protein D7W81_40485 [Corallococcus aberystwythensis]